MDLPERQGDLNTMLKAHMKKGRFEFSVTEGNKEGKSQMEVSKAHLRQKTQVAVQKDEGSGYGQQYGRIGERREAVFRKLGSKVVKKGFG